MCGAMTITEKVPNMFILILQTHCVAWCWAHRQQPINVYSLNVSEFYILFEDQPICQIPWKTSSSRNKFVSNDIHCTDGKCSFKDKVCLKDEKLQADSGLILFCATNWYVELANDLASLVSSYPEYKIKGQAR